jgi:DNA-binding NarL/FixJ family response regulator
VVVHQRLQECAQEIRNLSASAHALITEAKEAPVTLPADWAAEPSYAAAFPASTQSERLDELFTSRELRVVRELAAGQSNRQIATILQISPETVKTYVSRVMRKLGAANRADAAARYVRLSMPVGAEPLRSVPSAANSREMW